MVRPYVRACDCELSRDRRGMYDSSTPFSSFRFQSKTLVGCTNSRRKGVSAPHRCLLESGASYLCNFVTDVRTLR